MDHLREAKNLRTESKLALKQANKAWTDCISRDFLGDWLGGKDITINDVCQDELTTMRDLDSEIYGQLPFKTDLLENMA